jgi:hypothetical protein
MNHHIKNALLNGRLVLLLGAGASKGCKNSLKKDPPMGRDLTKILAEEIGDECEDDDDLSDVYAAARRKLGSQVQNIFEKHYKHCTPSKEYKELVEYPFFRIYSLNIDDAFEKAAYSINHRKFNVRRRNDKITDPDQFYQTLDLIKLNGDINNPNDGYIFSAQEYAKGSIKEPFWYHELARDYHRYTFVFIGTKLKESLFSHQIEKYKNRTGSSDLMSYILIPNLSKIKQSVLEEYNIHHIEGTLRDFTDWLKKEFDTPPTGQDIVLNTRPELNFGDSENNESRIHLFSGVTPVSRASLALSKEKPKSSEIREFYKGFKPLWFDILDEVPANLRKVSNFFTSKLQKNKPEPLELHILLGTAGCGKTTALKQLALKLADEGDRNVYFLEEYKDNFKDLIRELDNRNKSPYYLIIERIGDVAIQLSEIIKSSLSEKAIFISSENPKIWRSRVKEHVGEFLTGNADISHITESDASLILEKLKKFGNWTRLSKMSTKNRRIEIIKKSKRQLLIGLIEATSGEGYNDIIKKDYKAITCESERKLLLLTGLATTQRVPANESTLTRAMSFLNCNPNVHYIASKMDGIVTYNNGNLSARHRVYIERLFQLYVSQEDILSAIHAYIEAFSVYKFPIVKNISRNESSIYKHLVNARYLKRVLNNNEKKVLSVYERFEKTFEHEGLYLMQYGLALRSFDRNEEAFEKLRVAYEAFPESPHIEHALAQQRIILACKTDDKTISIAHFSEAETVLNRLHSSNININALDRYPIITLAEGHIKLMIHLNQKKEARILAKQYYDRIRKLKNSHTNSRLDKTAKALTKLYATGYWSDTLNQ